MVLVFFYGLFCEYDAISHSRSIGPAETIKIYVEDEVIFSSVTQPAVSYA